MAPARSAPRVQPSGCWRHSSAHPAQLLPACVHHPSPIPTTPARCPAPAHSSPWRWRRRQSTPRSHPPPPQPRPEKEELSTPLSLREMCLRAVLANFCRSRRFTPYPSRRPSSLSYPAKRSADPFPFQRFSGKESPSQWRDSFAAEGLGVTRPRLRELTAFVSSMYFNAFGLHGEASGESKEKQSPLLAKKI